MRPSNPILMNAQANTAGAKFSAVIDAQFIVSGSIMASFSDAAAAGALTLQGSNDNPSQLAVDANGNPVPVNWLTVANGTINGTATVASGALTQISMQWLNYRWLRVSWTRSAGGGTLTVNGLFQGMS